MIRSVALGLVVMYGAAACSGNGTKNEPIDADIRTATAPSPAADGVAGSYPRRIARRVTDAEAAAIEARIVMPDGADSLARYARYYTYVTLDGHQLIEGHFVAGASDRPGRYLNRTGPTIADGGCSVITLYYDPARRHIAGLFCNGSA